MKEFSIRYTETYSDVYNIEADTYEEACEKLKEMIIEDKLDGPMQCCDSSYEDVTEEIILGYCETIDFAMETAKIKNDFEVRISKTKSIHIQKDHMGWYRVIGTVNTGEIITAMSANTIKDFKHIIGITYMTLERH